MLNATPLPMTPYGTAIPVGCLKSRATQAVTLTSNAVVYASNAFSGLTKVMASIVLGAAGADTFTLTSKIEGWESEEISVQIAAADTALAVAVTGKAILITPKADTTCAQLAAAIEANPAANALVAASYTTSTAVIDPSQAKAYLDGWDAGNVGIYVMIQFTEDGFYGTFSEAETATKTASIPITAGVPYWEYVFPGHKISLKSATSGAIAYLTPAKQM